MPLAAAFRAVAGRNDSEVYETAAYRRYRAGLFNAYENLKTKDGFEAAYFFAARMIRGLHERTVAEIADEVIQYELSRPLSVEEVPFWALRSVERRSAQALLYFQKCWN